MHIVGIAIISAVGLFVWLLAALFLLLAHNHWQARWTRAAHLVVSAVILGVLAFGICRLILAIPAEGCGSSPAEKSSCSLG